MKQKIRQITDEKVMENFKENEIGLMSGSGGSDDGGSSGGSGSGSGNPHAGWLNIDSTASAEGLDWHGSGVITWSAIADVYPGASEAKIILQTCVINMTLSGGTRVDVTSSGESAHYSGGKLTLTSSALPSGSDGIYSLIISNLRFLITGSRYDKKGKYIGDCSYEKNGSVTISFQLEYDPAQKKIVGKKSEMSVLIN